MLRLYPAPLRFCAWAASLRRDLVLSLGFRRVARQPTVNSAPLLVLLLAVAVGVFSSIVLHSIQQGQVHASWQSVGAPYRIDSHPGTALSHAVDPTVVDGVSVVAQGFEQTSYSIASPTPMVGEVALLAVDTGALEQVNRGTPVDPRFPPEMLVGDFAAGIGTAANPIPAIVSSNWLGDRDLRIGDTFALNMSSTRQVSFIVVQIRDTFPTMAPGQPFVVASLKAMQSVADPPLFRINRLYVRASENAFDTLTASTATQSGSASVTSRAHEYDKVHDSPLIKGTEQGFQIGTLIAAAYSALAVAMALTERSRARDLASLRTLGLSGSQVRGLIVVEQVPLVLVALVVGIALGIAMVRLIEPGIDLTAFTGPGIPVSIDIDYGAIAALATALMTVVGVTIGVVSTVARRANLGRSLRLGDD